MTTGNVHHPKCSTPLRVAAVSDTGVGMPAANRTPAATATSSLLSATYVFRKARRLRSSAHLFPWRAFPYHSLRLLRCTFRVVLTYSSGISGAAWPSFLGSDAP